MSRLQRTHMRVDQFGGDARRLCVRLEYEKHNRNRSPDGGQRTEGWNKKPSSRAHRADAFRALRELLANPLPEFGRCVLVQVAFMKKCSQRLYVFQFRLAFDAVLEMT